MFIQHLALVLALATPQAVALHGEEMAVKPLMGTATVMQNAIPLVTAVKMSTALNVILNLPCLCIKQLLLLCIQSQQPVNILASRNVVTIRVVLGFAMSTSKAQIITVRVISLVMQGMIAVQMHQQFASVRLEKSAGGDF